MESYQIAVQSNPATDFLEGLAQDVASANVDIRLPDRLPYWFIKAIAIVSKENLAYELQLFTKASNMTGVIGTENFLAPWQFVPMTAGPPATPGYPVTGDALYRFYIEQNMIPYVDLDQMLNANNATGPTGGPATAKLHVRLINRSAAAKTAGAAGALQVIFYVSPQGAQPW